MATNGTNGSSHQNGNGHLNGNGLQNGTAHENGNDRRNGSGHLNGNGISHENDKHAEPIAIIGMGCRLPGNVSSPSKLWDLLEEGRSGHCKIPSSRFNAEAFYHPHVDYPGTLHSHGGNYLQNDIHLFENSFFGINNLEAKYMDPQQRQLLEVVFETFENAGIRMEDVSGKNIASYIANFTSDYTTIQSKDPEAFHRYGASGMEPSILANRINHVFNLTGPSCVLNTACSSSLYCLHVACVALEAGECDAAIVAGANLIQSPEMHVGVVKLGVISGTSISHSFDESADGYGRGEAVGALYVKRLRDAIRDGDPIQAVIRGSAVNSNGRTNGITLPSAEGQEAVIRKAYKKAGLPLDDTIYVEAHGTGTAIGDPIEVDAISRVFKHRSGNPTLVGSVKTNLGHSEAVSGISSIMKVVLAFEKGIIPPTIGIKNINPALKLQDRNVDVVTSLTPWPKNVTKRASVNSFGYGGANSHIIIEAPELHVKRQSLENHFGTRKTFLLPISGNSESSLKRRVLDLSALDPQSIRLPDLAYTLANRRSKLSNCSFLIAHEDTILEDLNPDRLQKLDCDPVQSTLPIAFVYTGQGAQWARMGQELFDEFAAYRRAIHDLDSYLAKLPEAPVWTLQSELERSKETSNIQSALYSQVACTAIQIAMTLLLQSWGITPAATVGHSSGEIVAAFAAGHLTAEEAIAVAYYRGLVVSRSAIIGSMIAVGLEKTPANAEISKLNLEESVRVACVNSPESVTLSGDEQAINEMIAVFEAQGLFVRKLKTEGHAYHSHHMASIGQEYEDLLARILYPAQSKSRHSSVRLFSSVAGDEIGSEVHHASYWRRNLEQPVLFQNAVEAMLSNQKYHFIEIGPHSALQLPIKDIHRKLNIQANEFTYSPTLLRGKNSTDNLLVLMGNLFLHGREVDFDKVNGTSSNSSGAPKARVIHDLPTYGWNHGPPIWTEPRISFEYRNGKHPPHELLGRRIPGGSGETATWRNLLKLRNVPWLKDHKLGNTVVFPAAGYIAMAYEGLIQLHAETEILPAVLFQNLNFLRVFEILNEDEELELFTEMKRRELTDHSTSDAEWFFQINSFSNGESTVHAKGSVQFNHQAVEMSSQIQLTESGIEEQATHTWYKSLARVGLNFGPRFQSITEIHNARKSNQTLAKTTLLDPASEVSRFPIHPITLDAMLQTGIIATSGGVYKDLRGKVPVSIKRLEIHNVAEASGSCTISAASEVAGVGIVKMNAELVSNNCSGKVLVRIDECRGIPYNENREEDQEEGQPISQIIWKPDISIISQDEALTLEKYAKEFDTSVTANIEVRALAAVLDLLAHKNPRLRVLDFSEPDKAESKQPRCLDFFATKVVSQRFQVYHKGSFDPDGGIFTLERLPKSSSDTESENSRLADGTKYDAIIISKAITSDASFEKSFAEMLKYLSPLGTILAINRFHKDVSTHSVQLQTITCKLDESDTTLTLYRDAGNKNIDKMKTTTDTILVINDEDLPFNEKLLAALNEQHGHGIVAIPLKYLATANVQPKSTIITTIEIVKPMLRTLSEDELEMVKIMTDNASKIIWITAAGSFTSKNPDLALVQGFSRALVVEQPSLKVHLLDLESLEKSFKTGLRHAVEVVDRVIRNVNSDYEYVEHEGALYCSRFLPNPTLAPIFSQGQSGEPIPVRLKDAGNFHLAISSTGQIDSLHFVQERNTKEIPATYLEIDVKYIGLNAKDIYALKGRIDTKNAAVALDHAGIVRKVGSAVTGFAPGDRVVVMAPSDFANRQCVPQWACGKLLEEENFETFCTVPLAFSTAIYALRYRGNLQAGESVLIHSAAGGVGIAAIQIAQLAGAEIYATVGTEDKRQYLIHNFGLKPERIFNSRDVSFVEEILAATDGKGIDVVLNSLTGELLHEGLRTCAELGRFIEIGKRDIVDGGKLGMECFKRGITFSAFDLSLLYLSKDEKQNKIWHSLMTESLQLLRQRKLRPIAAIKTFDIAEVVSAFQYFALGTRIGKVAVRLENPESIIQLVPYKYHSNFDPLKSYILVGCLGGLGRSLARWMFKHGARKFIFISRSGSDRPAAKVLIKELESEGGEVAAVRGDVASYSVVEEAVRRFPYPIGGVVQGAMALQEALFTQMTIDKWHECVSPKLDGAWNLHKCLFGRDNNLDFFVSLSSVAGSIGTATETNYCAANTFLDAFAGYRRSLGLPATSIGLGMVSEIGYLHEHPDIEAALLRKGLHPITQDEFLQICDLAFTNASSPHAGMNCSTGPFTETHILTGFGATGLKNIRKQGFEGGSHVLGDPRASYLVTSLLDGMTSDSQDASSSSNLPPTVATALKAYQKSGAMDEKPLHEAIAGVLVAKLSNLILMQAEHLDIHTKFGEFGLDSMLAAEFRQFIFRSFEADIRFPTLLAKGTTISILSDLVVKDILGLNGGADDSNIS